MIPPTIHPSVRSNAEKKLFYLIRDASGTEDWICLHSLGLARHITKRRGEIDFLLLTSKGIFVLEVKGGRVSREGGVWKYTDRYGVVHIKNESPFDQASSAMFSLENEVRQNFHKDKRCSNLMFGFGVMFPDIYFDFTGSEADPRQVYDAHNLHKPVTHFIDQLAAYWQERDLRGCYIPTTKDIEVLADFLRGDFDLVPPLGVQADTASEQFLSLEKEQYAVLDSMEQIPKSRILVQGGAGTGKTLLAVEAAKREVRKERGDVLFLCYNRLLAGFLESKIKAEQPDDRRITVKSIYSLLLDIITSSSLADDFKSRSETVDQTALYRNLLPEYAQLALIENSFSLFKTLIIDEAQDMMTQELLDVIDACVEGGLEAGRWWIFCDTNNQAAVFGAFDNDALMRLMNFGQIIILPTNRRNTKQISDETIMLSRPKVRVSAKVDGVPVKYSWYKNHDDQLLSLRRILKLLFSEDVQPGRITVLSPRKIEDSCAVLMTDPRLTQITKHNVWKIATGNCNFISCCSVSSFKGLENDFIVLTDIEDIDSEWWRSVIYVGMSRARFGLHLLLNHSLKLNYELQLRRRLEGVT